MVNEKLERWMQSGEEGFGRFFLKFGWRLEEDLDYVYKVYVILKVFLFI